VIIAGYYPRAQGSIICIAGKGFAGPIQCSIVVLRWCAFHGLGTVLQL